LLAKLREVEERYLQTIEDSTLLLEQTRTAAQGEIDRLHLRVAELENGFAVASAPPTVARPRVLIAHPDADLRTSARTSLERAGYEVVSAGDGLEALRTAIAERPDVVIADVLMPKMDGRELCQLLKSQEKTSHIRVVLLLRVGDEAPKGDLCPDEVLRKPVPLEILKSTLASLVARTPG
jgi:CheY-like chemotaxis protein